MLNETPAIATVVRPGDPVGDTAVLRGIAAT
jgi:hypothetical protein